LAEHERWEGQDHGDFKGEKKDKDRIRHEEREEQE